MGEASWKYKTPSSTWLTMEKAPPLCLSLLICKLELQQDLHSLEKDMATHSSLLAWRIPWTEEPGGLWCTGSQVSGST